MKRWITGVFAAATVLSAAAVPCLPQENGPHTTAPQAKQEPGPADVKVRPTQSRDRVIIEGNTGVRMPIIAVLQAVADVTGRKLIFSDDVMKKSAGLALTVSAPVEFRVDTLFNFLSPTFSVGKIGQDTYLIVPRQKSRVEIDAEKADMEALRKRLDEERKNAPPPEPKRNPLEEPFSGRFWLLSPDGR